MTYTQYKIYLWPTYTIYSLLWTHHTPSHRTIPGFINSWLTPPWSNSLWYIPFDNVQSNMIHMEHVWNGSRLAGIHNGLIPSPIISSLLSTMLLIYLGPSLVVYFVCSYILNTYFDTYSLTFQSLNLSLTLAFKSRDKRR